MAADTTQVWITLIGNLPAIIAASVAAVVSVFSFLQSRKNTTKLAETNVKLGEAQETANKTAAHVDGKMDMLLQATGSAAHADGVAEGRQLGITERQDRVTESERVEDRAELKASDLKT